MLSQPSPSASVPSSALPRGPVYAAFVALVAGGGLVVWAHRDPAPDTDSAAVSALVAELPMADELRPPRRRLPPPPPETTGGQRALPGVHAMTPGNENGVAVLKVQIVPGGDEIVVDAATGTVVEVRRGPPA